MFADEKEPAQLDLQHLAIKENTGIERLILRARRDACVDRKVGQELLDLGRPHGAWMALVMKEDEAAGPVDVAFLGVTRVMPHAENEPQLIEQARRPRLRHLAEISSEHAAVEQVERRAGLRQRRQWIGLRLHDMFEKLHDRRQAELGRMPFIVEQNEGPGPSDKGIDVRERFTTCFGCLSKSFQE
jgi:hypothetical protein